VRGLGGATVDLIDLGIIPRILFATDGGIVHILEAYAAEPVELVRLASSLIADTSAWPEIGAEGDERALRRIGLLRGRQTGRVLVHAEAVLMLDRMPAAVVDELDRTGASVLKLLSQHRIATFREGVGEWEGRDDDIAARFGVGPEEPLVARTYQIVAGGRPVAWMTETFPRHWFS